MFCFVGGSLGSSCSIGRPRSGYHNFGKSCNDLYLAVVILSV